MPGRATLHHARAQPLRRGARAPRRAAPHLRPRPCNLDARLRAKEARCETQSAGVLGRFPSLLRTFRRSVRQSTASSRPARVSRRAWQHCPARCASTRAPIRNPTNARSRRDPMGYGPVMVCDRTTHNTMPECGSIHLRLRPMPSAPNRRRRSRLNRRWTRPAFDPASTDCGSRREARSRRRLRGPSPRSRF